MCLSGERSESPDGKSGTKSVRKEMISREPPIPFLLQTRFQAFCTFTPFGVHAPPSLGQVPILLTIFLSPGT